MLGWALVFFIAAAIAGILTTFANPVMVIAKILFFVFLGVFAVLVLVHSRTLRRE